LRTIVQPAASAGATEAQRHAEREVPGQDVRGDALRLEQREVDHLAAERDRRPVDLVGGPRIVDEHRHRAVDVAPRLADRLAHVGGLEPGESPRARR
jgi:hypothetical protein